MIRLGSASGRALAALALARGGSPIRTGREPSSGPRHGRGPVGVLDRVERAVWDAVDNTPTTVETVLLRTNLSLAALTEAGGGLVSRGILVAGTGWWSRA